MNANLTEEEARVVLERLSHPERPQVAEDKQLVAQAARKMSESVRSKALSWQHHLVSQGMHPNTARQHVRHKFGEVEL